MRYAVLSDIHGNATALKAVLEDAKKQGIRDYIIAGDYCLSGPYPDECITILRQLKNAYIIRGNEEQYLENLIGKDEKNWTDGQMQISYWCYRNITKDNLDYMLNLPHTIDFTCNGVDIHIAHSKDEFIKGSGVEEKIRPSVLATEFGEEKVTVESLKDYIDSSIENCPDLDEAMQGLNAGVYIFGHTHIQWGYEDKERKIYLVNPGSCGLPLDGVAETVPYAVLNISNTGKVIVEKHRIPFDTEKYIKNLKHTTQYTEANVWSKVIIEELRSAKEHLTFFLQFVNKYAEEIKDERRPFALDTWEKAFELWENRSGDGSLIENQISKKEDISMNFTAFTEDIINNKWNVYGTEVYKDGVLIHSFGDTTENLHELYSATKTVLSLAVGIAYDEGVFDLNKCILEYMPEKNLEKMSDRQIETFGKISIHRLLTMSVGDLPFRAEGESWLDFSLACEIKNPEEKVFNYSNINSYLVGVALTTALEKDLGVFIEERLLRPLGITRFEYTRCPEGYFYGASGMRLTVNDLSKFGLLLMNKGVYDGKRIVSEKYVEMATSIQQMNREGGYGYFIWKYRDGYSINGKLKQKCYILPNSGIIVTYLSNIEDPGSELRDSMEKWILDDNNS
ncbi:MAG: serine hydrolase [Lachnospiraceae bacterium]|nr:serine hydrolase [Lachnospiraceae bacterium]